MFFGEYDHTIDEKGRLRIPARLKQALNKECAYLTFGVNGCLYILSESKLESEFAKLDEMSLTASDETRGMRRFASSITQIEEDGQGRFVLPANLRKFAGIIKNVKFLGIGKRIELWSKERWESYLEGDAPELSYDKDFNKLRERGM